MPCTFKEQQGGVWPEQKRAVGDEAGEVTREKILLCRLRLAFEERLNRSPDGLSREDEKRRQDEDNCSVRGFWLSN